MDRSWEYINPSQTHECTNGTKVAHFLEKEYINGIFVVVQSQDISFTPGREASIEYEPCRPGQRISPHSTGLYCVSSVCWSSCRGLYFTQLKKAT